MHGRERRKRSTRRALRSAVLELGLERGWAEVRVEEVAERAGVSARTFFNYFETKEDAALLDLFVVPDDELAALEGPAPRLWHALTELFTADVERLGGDGADVPRFMELQRRNPGLQARQMGVFTLFEGRLSSAIAARLPDDRDGRLRAGLMSGACITAVRVGLQAWTAGGWQGPPGADVRDAFGLLAPAFAR
ncbi:TetR/AcrR family transcriptional regulator [Pseudonocardia hydrocarbonoxydans]|jgi:AcrR family transcriptional regulator|uniref:TetR family transcriptional regulator n=1 Tax=Pseudonocardia hydrocarbonoxydans TaxID=76726 RepID=A0A4Y3WM55_9PSEU|nr:TetR/AcrR family transcriptional regulator [Pseudonocardia hydrocarbonoxydans]GEC19865.1 TetR family transcriptional regulator [Pseudonocardia hydrocarbonoxydans]